jgi:hypothetical protein
MEWTETSNVQEDKRMIYKNSCMIGTGLWIYFVDDNDEVGKGIFTYEYIFLKINMLRDISVYIIAHTLHLCDKRKSRLCI